MYYSGVIEHWGRGLSMIFEDCKCAGLQQPIVTDERGMVKVTFMRPDEAAPILTQPLLFLCQDGILAKSVGNGGQP